MNEFQSPKDVAIIGEGARAVMNKVERRNRIPNVHQFVSD